MVEFYRPAATDRRFRARGAALALACAAVTFPSQAASTGQTIGFAVVSYPFAIYKGANDCPDGMAMAAKELYLLSVTPAERERLTKPENLKEFEKHAYLTPDGKDFCSVVDYPRPAQRTPQGHISYGMNLDGTTDGKATPTTCAHEKLTSPDGEAGIDNQTYRVLGCSSNYRGPPGEMGYLDSLRNSGLKDGGTTILIELMGVKDTRNDDDIQVGIYNGSDPMALDATGHMLPYASLSVTEDKHFQTVIHAKIKDGVVITDPADIRLHYDIGGGKKEYNMRSGRLRLQLTPDGKAKGMLAGYLAVDDVDLTAGGKGKQYLTEMIGIDCPTFSQAVHRYADGYPDPATGKCTAISTAFDIEAVPAFIIHPEEARKTAEVASPTQSR